MLRGQDRTIPIRPEGRARRRASRCPRDRPAPRPQARARPRRRFDRRPRGSTPRRGSLHPRNADPGPCLEGPIHRHAGRKRASKRSTSHRRATHARIASPLRWAPTPGAESSRATTVRSRTRGRSDPPASRRRSSSGDPDASSPSADRPKIRRLTGLFRHPPALQTRGSRISNRPVGKKSDRESGRDCRRSRFAECPDRRSRSAIPPRRHPRRPRSSRRRPLPEATRAE